jgi:hypothetical protein
MTFTYSAPHDGTPIPEANPDGYMLGPDEGSQTWFVGGLLTFKAKAADTPRGPVVLRVPGAIRLAGPRAPARQRERTVLRDRGRVGDIRPRHRSPRDARLHGLDSAEHRALDLRQVQARSRLLRHHAGRVREVLRGPRRACRHPEHAYPSDADAIRGRAARWRRPDGLGTGRARPAPALLRLPLFDGHGVRRTGARSSGRSAGLSPSS